VLYYSNIPGAGNRDQWTVTLPKEPPSSVVPGRSWNFQLTPAFWFGMAMCDSQSYPQVTSTCTPDSDKNITPLAQHPGTAFMELQFYPPGFTPFVDSESCSATKWCAALTIDSLECTFGFATCNANCEEPVNFAYLQTNGVPTGPPSPQLTDVSSFLPNSHTLMINPGDSLVVSITDPRQGFTTTVRDLSTGQTGYMTASAGNGFMNTNIADCSGTPFTFHAEYSTAKQPNQVPWAAAEGGVLMEQEIGHSEVCNSVTNKDPFSASYPGGQSYSDPNTYDTCMGGSEGPKAVGEGPCNPTTGICQNSTTQGLTGPVACPNNNDQSGALCEYADGFCFQKGTRTVDINGAPATETSRANQCFANRYQNGDLDFDGLSYLPDWPNGSKNYPTSFQYIGPFTFGGKSYPTVQFESDIGGSSALCNTATGAGCTVPPISAKFYPFWSLSSLFSLGGHTAGCVWNFGNDQPNTLNDFGKDEQYGTPNVARYGGTIISAPQPNPTLSRSCLI
jgi:hypothetical protein